MTAAEVFTWTLTAWLGVAMLGGCLLVLGWAVADEAARRWRRRRDAVVVLRAGERFVARGGPVLLRVRRYRPRYVHEPMLMIGPGERVVARHEHPRPGSESRGLYQPPPRHPPGVGGPRTWPWPPWNDGEWWTLWRGGGGR